MADVEIKGKISVDAGASAKSINDLNKEIGETKKALKAATIGSEEHKAALVQLTAQNTQLAKATSASTGEQSKAAGAFGILKEKIGSIVPALKGAEGGASALNTGFKALVANPIGLILLAIVVALKAIYEAFTNTFAGGQKVEQVFAGIKAVGQSLIDSLDKIGSAIKNVFTFNFGKAISDIKAVGTAAGEAYSKMAALTKQKQQLDRDEADNELDGIKRKAQLADLKEKLNDGEVPIAEKKRLQKELMALAKENSISDMKLAKDRADNSIAALLVQKEGAEKNYAEIQKIKGNQLRGEIENSNELRAIQKQGRALDKQENAERKALYDEQKARDKEANQKAKEYAKEQKKIQEERIKAQQEWEKITATGNRKELEALEKKNIELNRIEQEADEREKARKAKNVRDELIVNKKLAELDTLNDPKNIAFKLVKIKSDLALELNALQEGDMQRYILIKKASDAEVQVNKDAADAKIAIANIEFEHKKAQVTETGNLLGALSDIVGKQTAVGKGLAIAQAVINTYSGATEALRAKSVLPSPFDVVAKVINVAAVLATGFKAVKAITAVPIPGGGGGGSAPSVASISAPLTPQAQTTALNQSSINGIGNAANGGTARSFVLDADISNNGERQRRLNRAARLS